ncbi:Piwi-domain-containing protein [Xylariaceae sp. FL0804]|nr:Piwi-domain-containing protein [Xylariaceae sp. FL0804]
MSDSSGIGRSEQGIGWKDPQAIKRLEDKLLENHQAAGLAEQMRESHISPASSAQRPTEKSFPRRPAYGKNGTEVMLLTNHFQLKLEPRLEKPLLSKYDIRVQLDQSSGEQQVRPAKGGKLKKIVRLALAEVGKTNGNVPYFTEFQSQLITTQALQLPSNRQYQILYDDEGKNDNYLVTFTGPTMIDLGPFLHYLHTMEYTTADYQFPRFFDAMSALTTFMGFSARSNPNVVSVGQSRYFLVNDAKEARSLGPPDYNEVIRGYFQSVRPATGQLLLNVNVTHAVFRKPGLVNVIMDGFDDLFKLHRALAGLRVQCKQFLPVDQATGPEQPFKVVQKLICGLATISDGGADTRKPRVKENGAKPSGVEFFLRGPAPRGLNQDSYCTVAQFYQSHYPVVNVGTKSRPVYMPAELLRVIPGQVLRRKTNADETKAMIRFACRAPSENATSISRNGRGVLQLDNQTALDHLGITVSTTLLKVHGRQLKPPRIAYKSPVPLQVQNGSWNLAKSKVLKPATIPAKWDWIHLDTKDEGKRFVHSKHSIARTAMTKFISEILPNMGVKIQKDSLEPDRDRRVLVTKEEPIKELRPLFSRLDNNSPDIVFVVLPGTKNDTSLYNAVKQLGDVEFGIHTICILESNLIKTRAETTFCNIGLKVNLKMGGTNHSLDKTQHELRDLAKNTMFVGYDVTHPTNLSGSSSTESGSPPSLVGMVASVDAHLAQWPSTAWAHAGRVEMLDDTLTEKFGERLDLYSRKNEGGALPANIVVFRDGVGEGQFQQVLDVELPRIREACRARYHRQPLPRITLVVSVKRHQVRFYPTSPLNAAGKAGNVRSGTVVDRGVTQAAMWDFFLVAQHGIQGTSRPAHYTVLLDEVFRAQAAHPAGGSAGGGQGSSRNAADALQMLTFQMCHLFGRATKAVGICPPAYYADLLCTRQRCYLPELFESSASSAGGPSGGGSAQSKKKKSADEEGPPPPPPIPDWVHRRLKIHERLRDTMYYI